MTSSQIRDSFLSFFASKQHRIVPSAPVIPHEDPTLLFTNAGMNQFKDVFLGQGTREYLRAADTQKCIRVSGKHNDLEEVGRDTYHHTFFEMLGNWSFGDYYKREAISWAWELLTDVWGLPKDRLHATVYKDDDEAHTLWTQVTDIDPTHIHRFAEKDNFWEMGETGPCGPCSEIHIDLTPDLTGGPLVNAGVPEVMEIWNLVFIQYFRDEKGDLHELPAKHVDTGMGFERICAVMQGKTSNYDTDIFMPLITRIASLSGRTYSPDANGVAMRVIADHIRMLTFAIADGAIPGNEGRSYVLRRILRRAMRFGRNLGFTEPFLWKLVVVLTDTMGTVFPEITSRRDVIEKIIRAEEESFFLTLDRGLAIFEDIAKQLTERKSTVLPGEEAFKLYDTFGFPVDLTTLLAEERQLTVDLEGFDRLLAAQKDRSRAETRRKLSHASGDGGEILWDSVATDEEPTLFLGYEQMKAEATVRVLQHVEDATLVVVDRTPFYAESGGQISDTGVLQWGDHTWPVLDVLKQDRHYIHVLPHIDDATLVSGSRVLLQVESTRRRAIMRNHTATHLLHAALRQILGDHVQQAGSLVTADKLRFDFTHFEKPDAAQLRDVEILVNERILEDQAVRHHLAIPFDDARTMGALMFFGDKYGDRVNVIEVPGFSMEFCGGTHVHRTSEIGLLHILSESSIASGTRRIEAVTGAGVLHHIDTLHQHLRDRQHHIDTLLDQVKHLEKDLARLRVLELAQTLDALVADARDVDGIPLVTGILSASDADQLKGLGDALRTKLRSGVGVLAAEIEGKVSLVCVVSDDMIANRGLKAGSLVGELAKRLGGGGGGRPHLATAGGKDVARLRAVMDEIPELLRGVRA